MIYWLGFRCTQCGELVDERNADLYIWPDKTEARCKNAAECAVHQRIKEGQQTLDQVR